MNTKQWACKKSLFWFLKERKKEGKRKRRKNAKIKEEKATFPSLFLSFSFIFLNFFPLVLQDHRSVGPNDRLVTSPTKQPFFIFRLQGNFKHIRHHDFSSTVKAPSLRKRAGKNVMEGRTIGTRET